MRQSALLLALAAALAACSNDDSGPRAPPPPGCDKISSTGTCYSDPAATETTCTGDSGTWLATGCPGGNVVGMCVGANGRTTYYYANQHYSYEAGFLCSVAGGTFTPMGMRVTGWCDWRSTDGICLDVEGTQSDVANLGPVVCADSPTGSMGTWHSGGACPTAGRLGTCSFAILTLEADARVYDPATAATAPGLCASYGGTWTTN